MCTARVVQVAHVATLDASTTKKAREPFGAQTLNLQSWTKKINKENLSIIFAYKMDLRFFRIVSM